MQFLVPKFIEHEARIVGPFTFRQFIFIGGAAGLCGLFYFTLPSFLAIILGFIVLVVGAMLAFVAVEGKPIPAVIKNFLFFSVAPKIYLWRRVTLPPKVIVRKEIPKTEKEESPPLQVGVGKSKLKRLSSFVESQSK